MDRTRSKRSHDYPQRSRSGIPHRKRVIMNNNNKPSLYLDAVLRRNSNRPPVWFMRQAGRYHSHYQGMKQRYSFLELCKIPEAAAEVTFGPIDDFDFDAAILFSDLLFPLEVLGMGLQYVP